MENKVALSAPLPEVEPVQPVRQVQAQSQVREQPEAEAPSAPEAPTPRQDLVDLRLVIEENAATGTFIYKTIDRRTGEVVSQLPREDVLKMQQSDGYEAGAVVKTQA